MSALSVSPRSPFVFYRKFRFTLISIGFLWSALERAEAIVRQADIVAAFTLDVLKGTTRAFDSCECLVKGILYKRWTLYWFIGCNLLNITPEISYQLHLPVEGCKIAPGMFAVS